MPPDLEAELREAVNRVLESSSRKKLIVAGPGAGKTTLFRELLNGAEGQPRQRLVLTFINALKDDLDRNLGDASEVFTLHGYCQHLLRRNANLRSGLSANFRCYPGLVSLIKIDWRWLKGSDAPRFVELMRDLACSSEQVSFYNDRAHYYDAVDFDDSVHRISQQLTADKSSIPRYNLVLIDEFQDFNKMEASVIDLLAERSPIVIAGDDDQALYSQLRGASWDHIRERYVSGEYEIFELPFCMRCPEVIVGAVSDVLARARAAEKLAGRIAKAYRYYPPVKSKDSKLYPYIELVETTVQRANANYFGRYIEECFRAIPEEEIEAAAEKHEPAALIIGSNPYRRQVEEYLRGVGLLMADTKDALSERQEALKILAEDPESNLGWRIILGCGDQQIARTLVCKAAEDQVPLSQVIDASEREAVIPEAKAWVQDNADQDQDAETKDATPSIVVTSFEGSKGRSAQYVFLIGLHSGEIPANAAQIKDIEICRFLVGLTRTKKKCSVMVTRNAMGEAKQASEFLSWINSQRFQRKRINAAYWKRA
jgi:superfamily I DNA/RNA helicase